MGTITDSLSEPFPGTSVPRDLATSAAVRCNDLLDILLRQVVVDGGPGARQGGFGLYELMHAVEDSFSYAHAERTPDGERVDYLRVWNPIDRYAFVGVDSRFVTPGTFEVGARGSVLRYAEGLNPFESVLNASHGYQAHRPPSTGPSASA
jgi:hypothetical protein